jgi:hypothetical protein
MEVKRYSFTHPEIQGQVLFEFTGGLLTFYKLDGDVKAAVLWLMLTKLPIREDMLSKISTNALARFTEIEPDLSFDRFMKVYNHRPAGYSRAAAERKWNKLSASDKQQAILYIKTYDAELTRSGVAKKYPETYINQKPWIK